jgi:hypothetical protein
MRRYCCIMSVGVRRAVFGESWRFEGMTCLAEGLCSRPL